MFKIMFLVHKRPDLDREEFYRYWREDHGPIAAKLPGIRRYVQNHSIPDSDGGLPTYDGFAEAWFDDAESFERALESPEGVAALDDAAKFMDMDRMTSFPVNEVEVV